MTTRDLGFVALKVMGLLYLVDAFGSLTGMIGVLAISPSESFPDPRVMLASGFVGLVGFVALSWLFLYQTDRLVFWLFGEGPHPRLELEAPDRFLTVGVIVVGVLLLGLNVGPSARFFVDVVSNLEGSRRPALFEILKNDWYQFGQSLVPTVFALVLMLRGDAIAARLSPWRESGADGEYDEDEDSSSDDLEDDDDEAAR